MTSPEISSEQLELGLNRSQINAAYKFGLRQMRELGLDYDDAVDLGFPTSHDDADRHFESGRELAKLLDQGGSHEVQMVGPGRKEKVAKAIGAPICGTCCDYAPCDHLQPDAKGKFRSVGY